MTELTDTERNRLTPWAVDADDLDDIAVAVEAILTARLARIEALVARWEATPDADLGMSQHHAADALRAALAAPTPDEVQQFSWVDKTTHKPCPTRGNVLCTITDADHRHIAAHMVQP